MTGDIPTEQRSGSSASRDQRPPTDPRKIYGGVKSTKRRNYEHDPLDLPVPRFKVSDHLGPLFDHLTVS